MADIKIIAYLCNVKTTLGHEAAAPPKERLLNLCPLQRETMWQPREVVETPSKASKPVLALTARSATIFLFVKTNTVMSNEAVMKKINERNAAHLLMTEFVKREASEIARALESIVTLHREVTYESLTENMSVVNQTFASIALTLIDHNAGLDPEDNDNMILPVGAKKMKQTIEDLSKFIKSTRVLLWVLLEKFQDDSAVKLASKTFWEYDNQM